MGHPCKISVPRDPRDHCYGRDVQKFGKIRTSNFEYLNSGGPYSGPMGHPCKISVPCEHCYGCNLQKFEKFGKIRNSKFELRISE